MKHMKTNTLAKVSRIKMMNEIVQLILKCKPREYIVNVLVKKYKYSVSTTPDLIAEAQKLAAQKFTEDDVFIAKQQIKKLSEDIISDEEEFAMTRIKAAELLGKLMKAFESEININNNVNTLNLSGLSTEQLKQILENKIDV